MREFDGRLTSPAILSELFREYGVVPLKKLGQNFLVDANALARIASAAGLCADACCLEIGPGAGVLTAELARRAGRVVAVEVDRGLIPLLHFTLQAFDNVRIVHGDILKQDLPALAHEHFGGEPFAVVANLPYNITTPAVMRLIESGLPITHMVILVQREVGERLCAKPGTKEYGALSVAVQYAYTVQSLFAVSSNCFMPKPKVESVVVRLAARERPAADVDDTLSFFGMVRALFAMRRKTVVNNLLAYLPDAGKKAILEALEKAGIRPDARAEALSVTELAALYSVLHGK